MLQKRLFADLKRGLFTDVTFQVGPEKNQRTFKAHRLVLASENPVFEKLFHQSNSTKIAIPDVHPKAFENLLRYCYGASFIFQDLVAVRETYLAAEKFQVPILKLAAENALIDLLKSEPVIEILYVCVELNLSRAKERCLKQISSQFDKVLMTEELALAPFDIIRAILTLCPGYASEFNVFAVFTLLEWAKAHECPVHYISYIISKMSFGTADDAVSFLRRRIIKFTESQLRAFHKYIDPEVFSLKKNVCIESGDADVSQKGSSISTDELSEVMETSPLESVNINILDKGIYISKDENSELKETSPLESINIDISDKGTSVSKNQLSEVKETSLKEEMLAKNILQVSDLNAKKDIVVDGKEDSEQKIKMKKDPDYDLGEENSKMEDDVKVLRKEAFNLIKECTIASFKDILKNMVGTADQMTKRGADNIKNAIDEMVDYFRNPLIQKD